jgi:hypothetical protein
LARACRAPSGFGCRRRCVKVDPAAPQHELGFPAALESREHGGSKPELSGLLEGAKDVPGDGVLAVRIAEAEGLGFLPLAAQHAGDELAAGDEVLERIVEDVRRADSEAERWLTVRLRALPVALRVPPQPLVVTDERARIPPPGALSIAAGSPPRSFATMSASKSDQPGALMRDTVSNRAAPETDSNDHPSPAGPEVGQLLPSPSARTRHPLRSPSAMDPPTRHGDGCPSPGASAIATCSVVRRSQDSLRRHWQS